MTRHISLQTTHTLINIHEFEHSTNLLLGHLGHGTYLYRPHTRSLIFIISIVHNFLHCFATVDTTKYYGISEARDVLLEPDSWVQSAVPLPSIMWLVVDEERIKPHQWLDKVAGLTVMARWQEGHHRTQFHKSPDTYTSTSGREGPKE